MVTRQSRLVSPKEPCNSCRLLTAASPGSHYKGTGIGTGSTFRTIGVIFERVQAGTAQYAIYGFAVFYALCLLHNWWFYLRKNAYVKNP